MLQVFRVRDTAFAMLYGNCSGHTEAQEVYKDKVTDAFTRAQNARQSSHPPRKRTATCMQRPDDPDGSKSPKQRERRLPHNLTPHVVGLWIMFVLKRGRKIASVGGHTTDLGAVIEDPSPDLSQT